MVDPYKNTVTKKLWSYIKSKRHDNVGSSGPLSFQGETFTDPLAKANIFANYFSSVFTNEDTSCIPALEVDPLPCVDPIQIHVEGVDELLNLTRLTAARGVEVSFSCSCF